MNKKLVCLLLAFLTIFSLVLSSCSVNSTEEGEVSDTEDADSNILTRAPVTLTLWVPGEATDEAALAVQDKINEIIDPMYATKIDLKVISEEDYAAAVLEKIESIEQKDRDDAAMGEVSKEAGDNGEETSGETTAVETVVDTLGVSGIKYPEVEEYQFDIFLITSYDQYLDYIDRGAIVSLESKLGTDAKVLNEYVYPVFFDAARFVSGEVYAIPNNHGVGEIKFLLLNRQMVRDLDYDEADLAVSFENCEEFVRDVKNLWMPAHADANVAPMRSWIDPSGMIYWSDDGAWSVLASYFGEGVLPTDLVPITSIFANETYKSHFKIMKKLEEDGMVAEDPDKIDAFGMGVVSGSISEVEAEYSEDYIIVPYELPVATQEDVFQSAFAISSATANEKRAMEIITALNTKPEIRNLLQYGIEGIHYELNDEEQADGTTVKRVHRLHDETGKNPYMMNIFNTGDVYTAYPEEYMPADQWEQDKLKNQMLTVSPYLFVPGLRNSENEANFAEIKKLSEQYYKELMETPYDELDTFFADANAALLENEMFAQMVNNTWEFGVSTIYQNFYNEHFAPEEGGEEGGEDTSASGDETTAAA